MFRSKTYDICVIYVYLCNIDIRTSDIYYTHTSNIFIRTIVCLVQHVLCSFIHLGKIPKLTTVLFFRWVAIHGSSTSQLDISYTYDDLMRLCFLNGLFVEATCNMALNPELFLFTQGLTIVSLIEVYLTVKEVFPISEKTC